MQNLQYATSDPQENRCPPGAKCNKVGCVSSASNPGLHSLSLGHTYSLLLNHLLSSFKRLNGVAKAGRRPPGQGSGWRAQLSVWAQGISVMLEHAPIADQNHSSLFPSVRKVKWQVFIWEWKLEKSFLVEEMFVRPLEKTIILQIT